MDPKLFFQSKNFKRILIGIGILIVLLLVFKAGEFVGFRKANFSYRWGENYYRSFAGPRRGFPGDLDGNDFLSGNGTFGSVLKVASGSLAIQSREGAENVILLTNNTSIKRFRETIPVSDLKTGDSIIVIGSPNNAGQIEAELIRVLPQPGTMPSSTPRI